MKIWGFNTEKSEKSGDDNKPKKKKLLERGYCNGYFYPANMSAQMFA